jgi:hypothetical protein
VTTHALPQRQGLQAARRTALVALGSALAGGLAVLALIGLAHLAGGSGDRAAAHTYTAPGHAFSIAVPRGWRSFSGAELARVPGGAAAVLRRADGRGVVVVRRTAPVRGDLRAVAVALTADLRARFPGFRLVSARLGRIRAGGAFLYTFVRGTNGAAQSLAITRVGGVTYRIDSVVRGDSQDTAREAGVIVGSFGP